MKNKVKKLSFKWTASALIVLVLLCAGVPSAQANKSICRKATIKCLVDATIALILSGPQTASIYASGCLNGYIWCLTYYEDF